MSAKMDKKKKDDRLEMLYHFNPKDAQQQFSGLCIELDREYKANFKFPAIYSVKKNSHDPTFTVQRLRKK